MKKWLFVLAAIALTSRVNAQNGLEGILVERYYKSTAADTVANDDGGRLPVGSVTYRIYADLLPGYRFQAAYGVPGHELRIQTTTLFFNNEDRGDVTPSYTKAQAKSNTVMLDSWLSVGAACVGNFGVMKQYDTDSTATVVNSYSPQVIQGEDASCGIPVKDQDGLVSGTPGVMTAVGINAEMAVFGSQNDGTNGPVFSTTNGSWACLGGSVGADSMMNHVLIAQITTHGQLSFKLNIQIGTPSGGVENYVAENPVGNEIQIPSLIYTSPIDTTASLSSFQSEGSSLRIYPNPHHERFLLDWTGEDDSTSPLNVEIFNLEGRTVFNKSFSGVSSQPVIIETPKEMSSGIYILKAQKGQNVHFEKLIKE
jgi:hypothetical protein